MADVGLPAAGAVAVVDKSLVRNERIIHADESLRFDLVLSIFDKSPTGLESYTVASS